MNTSRSLYSYSIHSIHPVPCGERDARFAGVGLSVFYRPSLASNRYSVVEYVLSVHCMLAATSTAL